MTPLLSAERATKRFAGLVAVNEVSFDVRAGEIVSIIGPNGAGKTTLFNLLTGQLTPSSGTIRHRGEVVNTLSPQRRARRGMGRTFQIAKPFLALTAVENAMVGAFLHASAIGEAEERAREALREVGLLHRAEVLATELTLSERRRLEVARALTLQPDIIFLDEVMAGLNQTEVDGIIALVRALNAAGQTILVIEHNLKVVRAFAERVIVIDRGAKIADGPADDVLANAAVVEAYLGKRR
jgi:branched-chain amino acid transport system ATP-binding protein